MEIFFICVCKDCNKNTNYCLDCSLKGLALRIFRKKMLHKKKAGIFPAFLIVGFTNFIVL